MAKGKEIIKIRVPFSDTDAMGIVHHSRYLIYLEMCRIEFMRQNGMSYFELQKDKFHLPVVEVALRYRKPSRFDDILVIYAQPRLEGARIIFDYEILKDQTQELVAKASTEHVLVDENLKMIEPPEKIKNILK